MSTYIPVENVFEGRLVVKLVIGSVCGSVPDLISDLIATFEDSGRLVNYDKFTESAASIKVGDVDLNIFGGSAGLVRIDLSIDSYKFLSSYANLVNTFKKLLTAGLIIESNIRYLEVTCSYETYIPLSGRFKYGINRVSELISRYGVVVNECNAESIDGMDLVSVSGIYLVSGIGITKVLYLALIRNYAVRSTLNVSKKLQLAEVTEDSIRRLATESYILAQLINEELYIKTLR